MSEDIIYLIFVVGFVLIITIGLVMVLFFIIPVYGAIEESDENFDFYGFKLIKYQKGNWRVSVGKIFDDNAVVRMEFPVLFRTLYFDWHVEVYSNGNKPGKTSIKIEKKVFVYRKRIRRV